MATAIYLRPEGGEEIVFPMLPEKVHLSGDGKFMPYSIINLGDVKLPRGSSLEEISWNNAMFPGKKRKDAVYVGEFTEPKTLINSLRNIRDKGTKCNLLITNTVINSDVYISKFNGDYKGGHGDFFYSISFTEARDIKIYTYQPSKKKKSKPNQGKKRPSPKKKKKKADSNNGKTITVTVKSGDCLWALAQKYLGNGARYKEIYNLNKATINKHHGGPNMIWPGDHLRIPSK